MSKKRGEKFDAPELDLMDEVPELEADEPIAEVVTTPPLPPSIPAGAYDVEIDLGAAAIGAQGFFAMKRALKQLRREYIRNLGALKGRNVKIILRVAGAPNT